MTTRAIAALLDIIADADAPMRRRIEAADALLSYESPAEVAEHVWQWLQNVFEDTDQYLDDRLDAVKLARRFEARKVVRPPVSAADAHAARELGRTVAIARRRVELFEKGEWESRPADWDADLHSPDYVPQPVEISIRGLAARVQAGRLLAANAANAANAAKEVAVNGKGREVSRGRGKPRPH